MTQGINGPDGFEVGKKVITSKRDNSTTTQITTFNKDAEGNSVWTVTKDVDVFNDGENDYHDVETYTYDKDGNLVKKERDHKVLNVPGAGSKEINVYHKNGKEAKYVFEGMNSEEEFSDKWCPSKRTILRDEQGRVVSDIEEFDTDGDGRFDTRYSATKDGGVRKQIDINRNGSYDDPDDYTLIRYYKNNL